MKKFRKITTTILVASLLVAMAMGFASCSSSRFSEAMDEPRQTMAGINSNKGVSDGYTQGETADFEMDGGYEAEDVAVDNLDRAPANNNANSATPSNPNQKLIRKMSILAETKDFNGATSTVKNKVAELGGYMDRADISGTGKNYDMRSAYYVIRIPANNLDALVNSVSKGIVILSSSESTTDVTLQYSDIESHIKALRTEQETLFELLAKSENLENTIVLQNRLSEIQYEIEAYESSLKVMANQVSYSTLSLTIEEVLEEKKVVESKKLTFAEEALENLKESLESIKEDAKELALLFVAAIPYLVILAVIAGIIVLIIKLAIRNAKKKAAKKASAKKVTVQPTTNQPKDETPSEEKK